MAPRVVVVGGGYGGSTAAKALDDVAEVVLVEPRDAFVHNVAALRGLVDPDWTKRLFLPYRGLLRRGRVLRDRAVEVDVGTVVLGSGQRLAADYIVLATGASYPFPAKIDDLDTATAVARLRAAHEALAGARRVLLLGAGPVGLELAGEITAAWPGTSVTIVDPAPDIVAGAYPEDFRAELRRQLDAIGVELLLGTALATEPGTAPGEPAEFTALTTSGTEITADIWFRCFGGAPSVGYLAGDLAAAGIGGPLAVTEHLNLVGDDTVFAIGDIAAVAEPKMAKAAELHAHAVAATITARITGAGEPTPYVPGPPGISLPLGPHGGASYAQALGVLGADRTAELKGGHLRMDTYRELLGLEVHSA